MKYEQPFEVEFIHRTLNLLKQYDSIDDTLKYEHTLFLNLCVGLLIIPQNAYFNKFKCLETVIVTQEEWGIEPNHISFGEKDIHNVIRHIRNSISHKRFEFISQDSHNITHIKIWDIKINKDTNKKEPSFNAKFSINEFRNFVINITEYALKNFAK